MEKFLLSLLCLLTVGFAGQAEEWTYQVSDDYASPSWLTMIKSEDGKGDISATNASVSAELKTISWSYASTGNAKTIERNGSGSKGITMGSASSPFSTVTFTTNAFSAKMIAKVVVKLESVSKKCYYNVSLTNGSYTNEIDKVLYQNNSGSANTSGIAEFEPNCLGDNLSFTIIQKGTTTNTKGGFKFCSVTITYSDASTPVDPSKQDAVVSFGEASKKNFEILDTDLSFTEPELTKTEGITVSYSSSEPTVATVAEDGKVTLTGKAGSTIITATFDGDETYNGASDSYTITVAHACKNIKDFMAIGNGNQSLIGFPMTVAFVHGKNIFATDEAGDFIQIYGENSYKVNDVIPAGWTGKYTIFNSVTPEIEPIGALPLSDETNMFVPKSISASAIEESLVNNVFVVKNVVFATATPSSKDNFLGVSDNIELTFRNNYEFAGVEAGKYDVTVLGNIYAPKNGDKQFQLYVISFAAAPTVPEIVCDHSIENGVLTVNAESTTLNFKKVDGIDIYYRVNSRNTPAMTRACDDITHSSISWVQHQGEDIPLTKDHESIEYFACNPATGAHSDTNKIMLDISTGVAEIEAAEAGEVRWFDMQGREVKGQPAAGVYVRVANGKAAKVVVK